MNQDEIDLNLQALVKEAYGLFSKYRLGKSLDVCPCCVFDEDVKQLLTTPLAVVSRELLAEAYYYSAPSGSMKALEEMKHFLPRILELMLSFEFPSISEEVVFRYVDLEETDEWEAKEIALLQEFARLYFKKVLTASGVSMDVHVALTMFGLAGFDLKPLLNEWKAMEGERPLLLLHEFFYYHVDYSKGKVSGFKNAFSEEKVDRIIAEWFNNEEHIQLFIQKIETLLLDESIDLSDEIWMTLDLLYGFLNKEYHVSYKYLYY